MKYPRIRKQFDKPNRKNRRYQSKKQTSTNQKTNKHSCHCLNGDLKVWSNAKNRESTTKSVKKLYNFHQKKRFFQFFLGECLHEDLTSQREKRENRQESATF